MFSLVYGIGMHNLTGCEKLYMGFTSFKFNVCSWFYVHWLYLGISFLIFSYAGGDGNERELLPCKEAFAVQGSC
jgi:hypothetical protein